MLNIIVTRKWMHPHYGGERTDQKRFSMDQAVDAEEYFYDVEDKIDGSGYEHVYIEIVHVL